MGTAPALLRCAYGWLIYKGSAAAGGAVWRGAGGLEGRHPDGALHRQVGAAGLASLRARSAAKLQLQARACSHAACLSFGTSAGTCTACCNSRQPAAMSACSHGEGRPLLGCHLPPQQRQLHHLGDCLPGVLSEAAATSCLPFRYRKGRRVALDIAKVSGT